MKALRWSRWPLLLTVDRIRLGQALEVFAEGFVGKGQSFDAVLEAILPRSKTGP